MSIEDIIGYIILSKSIQKTIQISVQKNAIENATENLDNIQANGRRGNI